MKKCIYSVIAVAVFAASAWATPVTELNARVPFEFRAGASILPAGTYRVTDDSSGFVMIRGEKGGVFVPRTALTITTDTAGKTSITFDRAGSSVPRAVHSEK